MPELPEVETIAADLREKLRHLEFSRVRIRLRKLIQGSSAKVAFTLRGKRILSVVRRGKYILFRLAGDWVLAVHLRMTGRLRFVPKSIPEERHTHVIFEFKNHPYELRFVDSRQFGHIRLLKAGQLDCFLNLGPEPLIISAEDFIRLTHGKKKGIKALLLDQRFLAGLGNIYADETLHAAGIHPRKKADSLSPTGLLHLHQTIRRILKAAILARGTSVRTYVDANGSAGGYKKRLRVYGRAGKSCRCCQSPILREKIAGRCTFYCPTCQDAGEEEK